MAASLCATGLAKQYGGITALSGVDLTLEPGQVHALLGANGAGKSTLVKILAGIVQPDAGTLAVGGAAMRLASPQAAFRAGIATVHQELSLFPGLSVAQNVLIGREARNGLGWIREAASVATTRALLARLGVEEIAPEAALGTLSLAQQQLVEIAKAMSFAPRVLILDEPSSALGRSDVARLLRVVRALRDDGCAIVFISHRMDEIAEIADQVTILRAGRKVGAMTRGTFNAERALELMLGDTPQRLQRLRAAPAADAASVLAVRDLAMPGRLHGITFEVGAGEVLGLAGLDGQGQKDLLFALFGLFRHGLSGSVSVRGRAALARRPRTAIGHAFALIPDDRKTMGGFLELSVRDNVAVTVLDRLSRWVGLDRRRESGIVDGLIARLRITCGSAEAPLASLSGGNQQKVVAAKWLARGAEVYLFSDPTRGVDAGAREILYETIHDLAAEGRAVIVYSTDMNEFPILCSRVLVLRGGRIAGSLSGAAITEEAILALSFQETSGREGAQAA